MTSSEPFCHVIIVRPTPPVSACCFVSCVLLLHCVNKATCVYGGVPMLSLCFCAKLCPYILRDVRHKVGLLPAASKGSFLLELPKVIIRSSSARGNLTGGDGLGCGDAAPAREQNQEMSCVGLFERKRNPIHAAGKKNVKPSSCSLKMEMGEKIGQKAACFVTPRQKVCLILPGGHFLIERLPDESFKASLARPTL